VRDLLAARNGQDNGIALGGYDVGVNLIHIENHSRDKGSGAVLRGSDLPHTVRVDCDLAGAVVADRVRKIQQDSVRIDRSINLGLDRSTDCDFDP
jgi:hypothetical protein